MNEQRRHFTGKSHTTWFPTAGHDKDKMAHYIKVNLKAYIHDNMFQQKKNEEMTKSWGKL